MASSYQIRLSQERSFFQNCEEVHSLPAIFHYWSDTYIRPKLRHIGFDGAGPFMLDPLERQCRQHPDRDLRFLSIGSGNCDLEIQMALDLLARGAAGFTIECLDLNETMLDRGRAAAAQKGVAKHLLFTSGDFNSWRPTEEYAAVLAIQALHHVVELEHLFDAIREGLTDDGIFLVSDMIGRNGHLRWPEALALVHEYWRRLPPSYRFNRQLGRYEEHFEDWDCSQEGFEGIRSQDILPLLIGKFAFTHFVAFSNLVEPFVSRSFGFHFDVNAPWDRAFIDELHLRDEQEMLRGNLKPTQLFAILIKHNTGPALYPEPFSPEFCVRPPSETHIVSAPADPYDWNFPQDREQELERLCDHLAAAEKRIQRLTADLQVQHADNIHLNSELEKRTEWARSLERDLETRTEWAVKIDRDLAEAAAHLKRLDQEFQERTEWALTLDRQIRSLQQQPVHRDPATLSAREWLTILWSRIKKR